jgi:hypothetical protein
MVQLGGLEPPTSGSTDRRSNQLSYSCTKARKRREIRSRLAVWQDRSVRVIILIHHHRTCPGDLDAAYVQSKSPGKWPGLSNAYATRWSLDQTTFLNALVTLSLSGSADSVVTFCASAVSSLVWPVTVSNCLRAWVVDSSTNSENDFTVISSV